MPKLALASGAASKRQLRVVRMSGPGGTHAANLAATGRQHSRHHTTNSSIGRQSDGLFFRPSLILSNRARMIQYDTLTGLSESTQSRTERCAGAAKG
jgi:hypothetical protein